MSSEEKKISVQRSDGEVEELTAEELERLNYDRKIRDQENAGKRVTPKQINIFAVAICVIGLVYALPRIFWLNDEETSNYVPLSERDSLNTLEVLPPLPRDPNAFLQGTPPIEPIETEITNTSDITIVSKDNSALSEDILELPQQSQPPPAAPKAEPTEREMLSGLVKTVEAWAADWADQNVDAYLSHYSEIFTSESGQNLQAWKDYRPGRLLKPEWIEIRLYEINAEFTSETTALVTFEQIYSASNYADQSRKQLNMVLEQGQWKISRELTPQ